jgi:hypothetical protein
MAIIAVWTLVGACVLFFGYQYFFRHTLDPWSTAPQLSYHGRDYRGGEETKLADFPDFVRVGGAPWPDRDVFSVPGPLPFDADPTVIVVYTWDHKYRSYGLVGGP